MVKLSWSAIQTMLSTGGYEISAALSDSSALLSLVGLTALQSPSMWEDYGDGFEIQDALALALYEVMTNMSGGDYEKIAESVYTSDTAYAELTDLDITGYHRLKIFASGLLSDSGVTWADHVVMRFNGDTVSTKYWSYGFITVLAGVAEVEFAGNLPGLACIYCAKADPPVSGNFGNFEATLFTPQSEEFTHMMYDGMMSGKVPGSSGRCSGQGTYYSGLPIEDVRLSPHDGDFFLIDPTNSNEPDELRITAYGLR